MCVSLSLSFLCVCLSVCVSFVCFSVSSSFSLLNPNSVFIHVCHSIFICLSFIFILSLQAPLSFPHIHYMSYFSLSLSLSFIFILSLQAPLFLFHPHTPHLSLAIIHAPTHPYTLCLHLAFLYWR